MTADRTPTSEGPRLSEQCLLCPNGHPNGLRHSAAEIRAYELGRQQGKLAAEAAASPEERGAGGDAPAIERIVADMPWPASCRHCPLVTEDPDAFFRPNDWDPDSIPDDVACPGSPSGVHECRDLHDYGLTRRLRATPAAPSEPAPLDALIGEFRSNRRQGITWEPPVDPKIQRWYAEGYDRGLRDAESIAARLQSTPTPTEGSDG